MNETETIVTTTRPKPRRKNKTRMLPPYHVIILNDDDHSFEFVMDVLRQVFGFELEKAFKYTKEAHEKGRVIVWTGPKEVAELKAEQVATFHEIKQPGDQKLGPVGCVIEPAPEG